jgi:LmbE family N-acetylglucosaminyl deacetylase
MLSLQLGTKRSRLRLLCIGAHSDDIEIGCGGTLLHWLKEYQRIEVTWVVLSAAGARGREARRSVEALLREAAGLEIILGDFQDAYLPADFSRVKALLGSLYKRTKADVVLTHQLEDRHQDHRLLSELTWQIWRNHFILEYEIPKYEGDLVKSNVFVPLSRALAGRKVKHLLRHFGSQRSKDWFSAETFFGLMRLRGIQCRAESGLAEGFVARKAIL